MKKNNRDPEILSQMELPVYKFPLSLKVSVGNKKIMTKQSFWVFQLLAFQTKPSVSCLKVKSVVFNGLYELLVLFVFF